MSGQVQRLDSSLAAKAKEADNAALQQFHEKVLALCGDFGIKEAARLLHVSTGYLRSHSEKHGITFADPTARSRAETRVAKKALEKARTGRELRQVEVLRPIAPGSIKITPKQEFDGKKELWQRQNAFYTRAVELAEFLSRHETAKILGVSVRFLKNYAYEWDIDFAGEARTYSVSNTGESVDVTEPEIFDDAEYRFGGSFYDAFDDAAEEPSFLDAKFDSTFSFGASFSFN